MKQSMVAINNRHRQIVDLFKDTPNLKVKDISVKLDVSELTIRRDLNILQDKGIIERYHGGAKLIDTITPATKYNDKNTFHLQEKSKIAKKVLDYVKENDTIFVNAGTTTFEVLSLLLNYPVTIMTNNIAIYEKINEETFAKFIYTGGEYNPVNKSMSGNLVELLLNRMASSLTILSVNGISSADGLTTSYYPETFVNEMFLKRSKGLKIVVVDSSKIGKSCGFLSAPLSSIDIVITDSNADMNEIEAMRNAGVEVQIV